MAQWGAWPLCENRFYAFKPCVGSFEHSTLLSQAGCHCMLACFDVATKEVEMPSRLSGKFSRLSSCAGNLG